MNELYLNGEYVPLDAGRVSIEDRGFQFGDGGYEVVRVYRGEPFRLKEHLARFERTLKGLDMTMPGGLDEVCRRVLGELKEATVYLQVSRGAAPRAHGWSDDLRPTVLAYARPISAPAPGSTYALLTVPDDRWGRCHLKTTCLLANVLAKQAAKRAGADEALFVRDGKIVTEGGSSNAFLVRDRALVTHPATNLILDGVTRRAVIELAAARKIKVQERPFTLAEALEASEFFMTSTTIEVMPVSRIDARPIPPGPVAAQLRADYAALAGRA
jgi:D-alanine transaminase